MKRGRRDEELKHIVYLLDISVSMDGQEKTMVDAINQNIDNLPRREHIFITIYTFNQNLKKIREGLLNEIIPIEYNEYKCWGSTSLYDCSCKILKDLPQDSLLIIATDGADTTSNIYTQNQCRYEMIDAQKSRNITIVYLAEGSEAITQGSSLEINDDFIIQGQDLSQTINSQQLMDIISQSIEI